MSSIPNPKTRPFPIPPRLPKQIPQHTTTNLSDPTAVENNNKHPATWPISPNTPPSSKA